MDSETFAQLRETVRRFVDERLIPNEDRVELDDAVPEEIVAEMRDMGLFGLTVPIEYGGLGLTLSE
ncbi:MAG: acyl-CoA dehydrogenase family protein, partial [Novosphingobium sp.]